MIASPLPWPACNDPTVISGTVKAAGSPSVYVCHDRRVPREAWRCNMLTHGWALMHICGYFSSLTTWKNVPLLSFIALFHPTCLTSLDCLLLTLWVVHWLVFHTGLADSVFEINGRISPLCGIRWKDARHKNFLFYPHGGVIWFPVLQFHFRHSVGVKSHFVSL